jgi:hypothetical protein
VADQAEASGGGDEQRQRGQAGLGGGEPPGLADEARNRQRRADRLRGGEAGEEACAALGGSAALRVLAALSGLSALRAHAAGGAAIGGVGGR